MKIKSLLIGSAAAMAVTGAQAADIITVPEPEPVEYVRVCDVYGAGFFYIPGTETCLKISGYVRYQIGATNDEYLTYSADYNGDGLLESGYRIVIGDTPNYHGMAQDEWNKGGRARVNFDTRSETEWGTLQGYIRVQGDWANSNGDANAVIDQGWLSLGGFRVGYSESAFVSTVNGGNSGYGSHSDTGMRYGYQQRQFVQYNFSGGNGFFATLSLENDPGTGNYVPDVVGKIGVTQGWGTAHVAVGWDETSTVVNIIDGLAGSGDSEFAVKGGVHLNIPNMPGNSLKVLGFYSSGFNSYWDDGEWSILASYHHQFTPTFGASVGVQYINDPNIAIFEPFLFPSSVSGINHMWLAELSTIWEPVHNFEVRTEVGYAKAEHLDGTWSGYLRFTRYFGD